MHFKYSGVYIFNTTELKNNSLVEKIEQSHSYLFNQALKGTWKSH